MRTYHRMAAGRPEIHAKTGFTLAAAVVMSAHAQASVIVDVDGTTLVSVERGRPATALLTAPEWNVEPGREISFSASRPKRLPVRARQRHGVASARSAVMGLVSIFLIEIISMTTCETAQAKAPSGEMDPVAITEAAAIERFNLRIRLERYDYGVGVREVSPNHRVEVIEGDLHVAGDLLLDELAARLRVEKIRARSAGDRIATTLSGSVGLVVTGNLHVDGAIINASLDEGPFLLVLGETRARALYAGGAEIRFEKRAHFEDAVIGVYNDGILRFIDGLDAPMLLNFDHDTVVRGAVQPPFFDDDADDGLDMEDGLSLLDPEIVVGDASEFDASVQLLPRIRRGQRLIHGVAMSGDVDD